MTLNILFFSITIKKRKISPEERLHYETAKKFLEENKRKIDQYIGPRQY